MLIHTFLIPFRKTAARNVIRAKNNFFPIPLCLNKNYMTFCQIDQYEKLYFNIFSFVLQFIGGNGALNYRSNSKRRKKEVHIDISHAWKT